MSKKMEDPLKEVKLDKRYRLFVRDDNEQMTVGMDESLFQYTPTIVDPETGEVSGGEWIPDKTYLIDYGTSVTYTWVIGKYYEDDDPEKVMEKYTEKELETNA
jgi:hypothetical protein